MRRDDRAGDDRLARSGWRDEHAEVVPDQFRHSRCLCRGQGGVARELLRRARRPLICCLHTAACLFGERGDGAEHAARQDQAAVDGLVKAVQEPRDVVRGGAHPLPFVELRVMHRRCVPQRRCQGRGELSMPDPDARSQPDV